MADAHSEGRLAPEDGALLLRSARRPATRSGSEGAEAGRGSAEPRPTSTETLAALAEAALACDPGISRGGETTLANLVLFSQRQHRLVHEGGEARHLLRRGVPRARALLGVGHAFSVPTPDSGQSSSRLPPQRSSRNRVRAMPRLATER
jgi:hypothetical protein